jgi:hypothetical protein
MYMRGMGTLYYDESSGEWLDDGEIDSFEAGGSPQSVPRSGYTLPQSRIPGIGPSPIARNNGQLPTASGNVNPAWTGLITSAFNTWGNVTIAKTQAEVQRAAILNRSPYFPTSPLAPYSGLPGYSPFPGISSGGTLFGMSTGTVLIIGAALAAVVLLSNRS